MISKLTYKTPPTYLLLMSVFKTKSLKYSMLLFNSILYKVNPSTFFIYINK